MRETAKHGSGQKARDNSSKESIAPAQLGISFAGANVFEKEVPATEADIGRNDAGHRGDCDECAILCRSERPGGAEEIDPLKCEFYSLPET